MLSKKKRHNEVHNGKMTLLGSVLQHSSKEQGKPSLDKAKSDLCIRLKERVSLKKTKM
jgi:hypothetical protein